MHHIPKRTQHVNVNPWPAATRRLAWFTAALLIVFSVPLLIDWSADHLQGEKRYGFPWSSLSLQLPGIGIITYLLTKGKVVEVLNRKYNYATHYLSAVLVSCAAVYFMWSGMYTDALDRENPASYPYPYHGAALVICNWICFFLVTLMAATLVRAVKVGYANRYEDDDVPL